MMESTIINNYILSQEESIQPRLFEVYTILKEVLPDTTEKLSWKMPTFWKKHNIIHFAANKNHIGIYPGGEAVGVFGEKLVEYKTSKGAIQLPHNQPIPKELLIEIAEWCLERNGK